MTRSSVGRIGYSENLRITVTNWEEVEIANRRPIYGPPCGVTPQGHKWRLSVEEGQASFTSGCDECDSAVLDPVGGDDVWLSGAILGRLKFVPDHPNLGGWHGLDRCDCGWIWEFIPEHIEGTQ